MKTLHLLRHAKSSWNHPELSDRERGLNKRGKRDGPRMGQALAQRMAPLQILVSPARRAQLTLGGLRDGWPALSQLHHITDEDLYTFSADDLFAWLQERDDAHSEVFVIGHNPALTDLVNALVEDEGLANLPTAGYLELVLHVDHWRDIRQGCGRIEYSLFPRQL
jgi:phosphohistidine phosphatase